MSWGVGSAPSPAPVLRMTPHENQMELRRSSALRHVRLRVLCASASRARIARSAHSRRALPLPLTLPLPARLCFVRLLRCARSRSERLFPRLSSDVSERPRVYVYLRGAFENENARWRCCCCGLVSSASGRDRCGTGGTRQTAADAARVCVLYSTRTVYCNDTSTVMYMSNC